MSRPKQLAGVRHQLRTMQVGEVLIITREEMRPTSVRSTCSQLKSDEAVSYEVKNVSAGVEVKRIN